VKNLRADDRQDERSPGQITRVVTGIRRLTRNSTRRTRRTTVQPGAVVAVPRTGLSTTRPRENGHGDESTHEEEVQQHPYPAKRATAGVGALLDAAEERGDEGVEHGGSEDAFNGAVCAVYAATRLNRVYKAENLVKALREDAKRDDGGDKLQEAGEAQEHAVEGTVLELVGHETGEETGLLALVVNGRVDWAVDGLVLARLHHDRESG
jgi:hypothetical protein